MQKSNLRSRIRFLSAEFALIVTLLVLSLACSAGDGASPLQTNRQSSVETTETASAVPADCVEFQKLVDQTYDFKPSKLSDAQQTRKSGEMDVVWNKVKADQKGLKPCLVAALESPSANSFFRFDGATLLLSIDQSDASKKLLIKSYAQAELEDIMLQNWIAYILQFGLQGMDTSEAGNTWLRAKDPFYYLPQHGTLKVDKNIGALAIFGSMDEQYATPALVRIASQKDHPGRDVAADVLSKQVTVEAFSALAMMDRTTFSESTRSVIDKKLTSPTFIEKRDGNAKVSRAEFVKALKELGDGRPEAFMDLADRVTDGEKDAIAVLLPEDIPLVRKARRFYASTGTPHAPEWYQSFTDILMVMVWKPEFEKRRTSKQ
jgi:hypothetical protein